MSIRPYCHLFLLLSHQFCWCHAVAPDHRRQLLFSRGDTAAVVVTISHMQVKRVGNVFFLDSRGFSNKDQHRFHGLVCFKKRDKAKVEEYGL